MLAGEDAQLREKRFGRLSRGWMIDSKEFRAELKKELAGVVNLRTSFGLLGADREAHCFAREAVWEQRLEEVASAFGVSFEQLPAAKSALPKLALAMIMKRTTSVSNRWLADRLQMGQPSSVATILRRIASQPEARSAQMERVLSRFLT